MNLGGLCIGALIMAVSGFIAYSIWDNTPDYGRNSEYGSEWWLSWSGVGFGVVILLASIFTVTSAFSTALWVAGVICFVGGLLFGLDEGEFNVPLGPFGMGMILSWGVLQVLPNFVSGSNAVALVFVGGGIILIVAGIAVRSIDQFGYDWLAMVGFAALAVAVVLLFGWVRTPLDHLNTVLIPEFNNTLQTAEQNQESYETARSQMDTKREIIRLDFSEESPAYLGMVDQNLTTAEGLHKEAAGYLDLAGLPQELRTEYKDSDQQEIVALTATAVKARDTSRAALDELMKISNLVTELSTTWTRTYLWTEIAAYWPSESYDSNHPACYYGMHEVHSVVNLELAPLSVPDEEGNTLEVVSTGAQVQEIQISDAQEKGESCGWLGCGDNENSHWKVFSVDDYNWMVQNNLIPPMDKSNPSQTDVGNYLCSGGENALIQEGTTFVKESGTILVEEDDQENVFIGNYDYGQWCEWNSTTQQPIKVYEEGELLPTDGSPLEWCWYMPENGDAQYYYGREYDTRTNTYVFINYGRRCWYCNTSNWSGRGGYAPAGSLSQTLGTDRTIVRGPADIGGGPSAGK